MGFSNIASHLIMFIAVMTIAATLIFTFNAQLSDSAGTVASRQRYLTNQMRTAITIESVKYDSSSNETTAYVKNIGDSRIYPNQSMIYIDGDRIAYDANLTLAIEADTNTKNTDVLDPNEILKMVITKYLDTSDTHELVIVTQYNGRAAYEYS